MEELRLAFLVIGAVAIIGILVHGMWSVRKNTKDNRASLETPEWDEEYDDIEEVVVSDDAVILEQNLSSDSKVEPQISAGGYDDLGIGAVRVVASNNLENEQAPEKQEGEAQQSTDTTNLSDDAEQLHTQANESEQNDLPKPKIYSSVVTQPKPEYAAQQVQAMRSKSLGESEGADIPEPPPFLLKTSDSETTSPDPSIETTDISQSAERTKINLEAESNKAAETAPQSVEVKTDIQAEKSDVESEDDTKVSLAEQARNFVKRNKVESKPKPRKRREPKIREDQMRIDFDEPEEPQTVESQPEPQGESSGNIEQPQEVLVLNVRASDENPIQGAALLPMLLTLGFKFGDQDIFHRHVNSNGKGPVLFSLANMLKPGIFDIDNLENFSTPGVSLFMMLPIEGDPHQVFNMMHNAARKIADEFSAQVLDGRRSALTKQSLQQYVEKIREFERQRMIAK